MSSRGVEEEVVVMAVVEEEVDVLTVEEEEGQQQHIDKEGRIDDSW